MKCPYCETHIDEHEALDCLNLWVMQDVFGWTTSTKPYTGDFYPKGSYFVIWHQPEDFMPETLLIVSQAFDKDGNNLRSTEENPFGMWEEGPSHTVPFFYSTRIADAWLVLEHITDSEFSIRRDVAGKSYLVGISGEVFWDLQADTAPLAICRAAIKATLND